MVVWVSPGTGSASAKTYEKRHQTFQMHGLRGGSSSSEQVKELSL